MGTGHVRITEQPLHLVLFKPGVTTSGFEQPVHGLDAHFGGIGLIGPPERQGLAAWITLLLTVFGVFLPGLLEKGPGSAHLMSRLGQTHQRRSRRTDRRTGVGTHAGLGLFAEHLKHPLGNTQAHGGKTAGEVRTVRRVEDLAVRVQTETCGLAFHHVLGFLDAVFRH
ncbi:hypothetical protein D3C71_1696060 [compost metagenome]